MDKIKLGEYIAETRKAGGLTQREMADALNVSVSTVSKWERGVNCPDLTLISPITDLLNITPQELLTQTKQNTQMSETDFNQCLKELIFIASNNSEQNRKYQKRMHYLIAYATSVLIFFAVILVYHFASHIDPVFAIVSSEYSIAAGEYATIKNMDMVIYVKGNADQEDFGDFSKDIFARWQSGELATIEAHTWRSYNDRGHINHSHNYTIFKLKPKTAYPFFQ